MAWEVRQPLKKTHRTELPRKTLATSSSAGRESVAATLVLEGEAAPARAIDGSVTREVHDVRPALRDQLGQLVEAARLREVQDHPFGQTLPWH